MNAYDDPPMTSTDIPPLQFNIKLTWVKRATANEVKSIGNNFEDIKPHFFLRLYDEYGDKLKDMGLSDLQIQRLSKEKHPNPRPKNGLSLHHIQPRMISGPKKGTHENKEVKRRWKAWVNGYRNIVVTMRLCEKAIHKALELLNKAWMLLREGQWQLVALVVPNNKVVIESPKTAWILKQEGVQKFLENPPPLPPMPREAAAFFSLHPEVVENTLENIKSAMQEFLQTPLPEEIRRGWKSYLEALYRMDETQRANHMNEEFFQRILESEKDFFFPSFSGKSKPEPNRSPSKAKGKHGKSNRGQGG